MTTAPVNPASQSAVAEIVGFEVTKTERAAFDAILAEIDRLTAICEDNAPGVARARLAELAKRTAEDPTDENFAALGAAGVSDLDEVSRMKKTAAREAIRRMGPRVAAVLIPVLERFAAELGNLIAEREEGERAACDELDAPFEPSTALRSLTRRKELTAEALDLARKAPEIVPAQLRATLAGLLPGA